ncbi:hypothetical protein [Crocosphaera sp. XPORK-15E]|uniref:hypothetical protein n=1 Tax=Crocosphaera sp. XPORK-15E TaxID=3110247 RepID=UPI002B22009D|nr:hypothetical protein [Crocosphaera sp. XPORK-15E]MEA5534181.1 hypothetical protein [Crocosphaera sp. XPORK-15E]
MAQQLLEALGQVIAVSEGIAEFNQEDTLEVALPPTVAKVLGVPDSVTFSTSATQRDCAFVSYNSEIFQRCETLLGDKGRFVSLAVEYQGYLKQSGFEKLISETLIPHNGLLRVGKATPAWTPYCRFNVTYTAIADEKRLGLVSFWLNGLTQVPGVSVGDALFWESDRTPVPEDLELDVSTLVPLAQLVARESIDAEIAPWFHSKERRLNRDQQRLTEYYQTIIQEIHHKCQKKKLEGEALAKEMSRIEATQLELERKLIDLQERATLTIEAEIHSVMVVWLQTVQIECELIRKKNKRSCIAVYNPYTQIIEPWRCEATNVPITDFILDEGMRICRLD